MAVVAAAVLHADADAPVLALVVLLAPLAGLLRPLAPADITPRSPRTVITLAVIVLVLAAQFRFLSDVAVVLVAAARAVTVLTILVFLLAAAALARGGRAPFHAVPVAVAGIAMPLVALALTSGIAPWTAWTMAAARTAVSFGQWSAWTHDGGRIAVPTTVTFTESHRVTAVAPGVFRVVEHDGPRPATRDWHLGAGESLPLRPGDELSLAPDTRVRFEAGKRVPGAAVSGPDWAQPATPHPPLRALVWLGAITLAVMGGGIALGDGGEVRSRVEAVMATAVAALLGLAGVTWGVYTTYLAPDVAMGSPRVAALVRAPLHALRPPLSTSAATALAVGLGALFVLAALALQRVMARALGTPPEGRRTWSAFALTLLAAAGVALTGVDAWALLILALALAAATLTAPAMAASDGRARDVGAVVAAIGFVATAWALGMPRADEAVAAYPALVAGPLGWLAARALRSVRPARARRRASAASR